MADDTGGAPSDELSEEWVRRHLDEELGTAFDWESFSQESWEDKDTIVDHPNRVWVEKVEQMLKKGGAPNKVYLALTLPLRQAHLALENPEDDEDGEIAEFVEDALLKPSHQDGLQTPLRQVISQMTHAIAVKRMFFEKVFHKRESDGKIIYSKIMWRPPEACELLRNRHSGDIEGFKQYVRFLNQDRRSSAKQDSEGYATIPAERTFVYIHGSHRDPYYGVSDLEATYWTFELRMKVLALWHLFLDRSALGKIIAYGETETIANARAKKMSQLRSSGTLGIELRSAEERVFDQITAENTANATFREMVNYLDAEMTGSVLANWADLASSAVSGKGSYALSADQSSLFLSSRAAVAAEMSDALTDHVVAPLVKLNFGPDAAVPKLRIEVIDDAQTQVAMQMLNTFAPAAQLNIPEEFTHMLMERVGVFLDLDPEKIRTMLEEERERLEVQREREEQQFELQQQQAELSMDAQAQGMNINAQQAATQQQLAKQGMSSSGRPGSAQKPTGSQQQAKAAVNVAGKALSKGGANRTSQNRSVANSQAGKDQQKKRGKP